MSDAPTTSSTPAEPRPPAAELHLDPVQATPGRRTPVTARLTNRGEDPTTFRLAVLGFETGWVGAPEAVGPLAPGASAEVPLSVHLPTGYPACTLVGALTAHLYAAEPDPASAPLTSADLVVTVGDGSLVSASLEPPEARGWGTGKLEIVLRNRGATPTRVELTPTAPDERVRVRFANPDPVLDPGSDLRVKTKVRGRRHWTGAVRRHPFGVRVQGRSTPVLLEGTLVQRPLFSGGMTKVAAILLVASLWIAAAVVGIGALNTHLQRTAASKAVAGAPPLSAGNTPSGGPGATSGGGGGSGSGSAGSGGGAPGSSVGPSSAGGPASGVRVGGKVTAPQPGGVTVTVAPTSLANSGSSGAVPISNGPVLDAAHFMSTSAATASQPLGKVYGTTVQQTFDAGLTATSGVPTFSTKTTPDGTWAISGLKAPGTYVVTFSKPGFSTKKYLLTTTSSGTTIQLNATISTGNGTISGRVTGTGGRLGGVTITVTDGTVTVTTHTPTVGRAKGTFDLTGLTTPDVYLVTAAKPGYGTETTLVKLTASGSARGIHLALRQGVGSITGKVVSARGTTGIGGITVTASSGSTTEQTTTATNGAIGSYDLPNLPVPGTYALTISGAGWVTQTSKVQLTGNQVVGASLVSSGADVVGFAYGGSTKKGLPAAGVVLTNGKQTYKTLSQSTAPVGRFDFAQVPAGTYVLTIEDYGWATASAQVVVTPGAVSTKSLVLKAQAAQNLDTGTIRGTVNDLFDQKGLAGVALELDGSGVASSGSNGTYQINNVAPGVHTVTAVPSAAQGFEAASVQVNVPLGGTVFAPVIQLPKFDSLNGTVTSAAGTGGVAGASVQLVPASDAGSTTTTTTASGVTTTTVPSGGVTTAQTTTTSSGTYSIADLAHGNYQLTVSAPGYVTQNLDLSLAVDQSLNQNVTLTLEPAFNVVTYAAATNGGVAQTAGVCVTVTGPNGYDKTELSSASSATTFSPLTAGDSYKATFWQPATTAGSSPVAGVPAKPCPQDNVEIGTAPSKTFTAQFNNVAVYTAFMAPQLPAVSVTLTYQFQEQGSNGVAQTVDCPVVTVPNAPGPAGCPVLDTVPTVAITGVTSYQTGTNGSLGSPVYSSPIQAVSPSGTTSDTWSFPAGSLHALVSKQVTISIDGSSTPLKSISPVETLSGTSANALSFILVPTPVTVTGTVSPASGVTLAANPGQIPVSKQSKYLSPGQVTLSDASGGLIWSDTQIGTPGLAQPGVYTVSGSATGYESGSVTIEPGVVDKTVASVANIPVLTGANTTANLSLTQETTLTVSTDATAISGLAAPTAYLMYNGALVSKTNGGAVTVTDNFTDTTTTASSAALPVGNTLTFKYLKPTSGYSLVIVAPGYQTYFKTLAGLTPSTNVGAHLVPESVLTGTVKGQIPGVASTSDLQGVTVTATLKTGTCPGTPADQPASGYSDAAPATITTTTNSSGQFTLAGSPSVYSGSGTADVNGGLCPGATYDVTESLAGYTGNASSPASVTPAAVPPATTVHLATMVAQPITQVVTVATSNGASFSSNALPAISVSNALGQSFSCQAGTSGTADCSGTVNATSTQATFSLTVYPTAYNYVLSAPTFNPLYLSAISYAPAATPSTLAESLSPQLNTITGAVTIPTTSGTTPVPGLQVGLYVPGNATPNLTATATSSGTFTFTNVLDGSYQVSPLASTGYSEPSGATTFSTAYPSEVRDDISVTANTVSSFAVSATTTAPDASNLDGASVTLTPTSPANPASYTCKNAGGSPLLVSGPTISSASSTLSGHLVLSGSSASVSFASVPPNFYTFEVSSPNPATATSIPPQTSKTIEICPATSTAGTTGSASFPVQEAEIDGSLAVTPSSSASPTIAIHQVTTGTTEPPPVATCSGGGTPPCGSFTFLAYEPLGASYTLGATLSGYPSASGSTGTLSSATPSYAWSAAMTQAEITGTITLKPAPSSSTTVTVDISGSLAESTTCTVPASTSTCTYKEYAPYTVGATPASYDVAPQPTGAYTVTAPASGSITWNPTSATPVTSNANFTLAEVPTITAVSPSVGPTLTSTSVTITGTNLAGATAVKFGSKAATVTADSATSITATSPTESAGTVDVTVTTPGGTSATTSADKFTYVSAPAVTGVSPTAGSTAGGTTVTITGTNLASASAVDFGSGNPGTITADSATSITVTSPAGSAGTVDVTVTTPGGTSSTGPSDKFTFASTPTVTGLSPSSGSPAGGTSVTITGTNLASASAVDFGSGNPGTITADSATSITVTSPAGSTGTVDVTVTTPGGTSSKTSADKFTYASAPAVTGLSPTSGSTAGGTTVTITGTNLSSASAVDFGSGNPGTITADSATSITVTSPAGSAGTADVTVTTPGGTSSTGPNDKFTYVAPPTITSFSPSSALTGTSTTVTVNGSNLVGSTTVNFLSSTATTTVIATATVTPTNSGKLKVTISSSTSATTYIQVITSYGRYTDKSSTFKFN